MKNPALLTIPVLAALLASHPCHARPIRINVLDSDVEDSAWVFFGKVESIVKTGTSQGGVEKLDMLSVATKVRIPVKGKLKAGDSLSFLHWRVNASSPPVINGLSYQPLDKGATYLFFLEDDNGQARLLAPESWIVKVPGPLVKVLKQTPKGKSPTSHLVNLLVGLVENIKGDGHAAVHLLSTSKELKSRLKAKKFKKSFVKSLVKLTRSAKDENTLLAAYTFLGDLGETSVIKDIVDFIAEDKETGIIKQNAVNWLQGFSPGDQAKGLEEIIKKSGDPAVVEYAKERLKECKKQMQ